MKKLLPLLFLFSSIWTFAQSETLTYIPEDDFEQALINLGYDDVLDDYVLTSNIDTITELDISNLQGNNSSSQLDLTGIENFIALKILNCSGNDSVFTLNTSQMPQLEELNVSDSFATIDTKNNPELRKLLTGTSSFGFGVTGVDVSQNPKLEELFVGSEIDLSNNPLLKRLSFSEFSTSVIDVSNNPELEYLSTSKNDNVSELDLSNNPKLVELRIGRIGISTLDLSNNPALEKILATDTFIQFINLQNGNIQALTQVNVSADCVQVDDVDYAKAQSNWSIGTGAFAEDCTFGGKLTYIPDDNFEQVLIELGRDDVLDDYVATADIATMSKLYLSNNGIFDLTGLSDFTNLKELFIINNPITQLNLSPLVDLERLELESTDLSVLVTKDNKNLFWVELRGDIEFDLSENTKLLYLTLEDLEVSALDFSNFPVLRQLQIRRNNTIVNIDLSLNPDLKSLDLRENGSLQNLNVRNGNNANLDRLMMYFNENINCIEVDDVNNASNNGNWVKEPQAIYSENCNTTGVTTYVPDNNFEQALIDLGYDDVLDDYVLTSNIDTITELNISGISRFTELSLTGIEAFTALELLNCSDNLLNTLNIRQLSLLQDLDIFGCAIDTLDTTLNPELRRLRASGNAGLLNGPILDLSDNPKLEELTVGGSGVDLSNNPLLQSLTFLDFSVLPIDVSHNPKLQYLDLGADSYAVNEIDLSNNPELLELRFGETGITSFDLSHNSMLQRIVSSGQFSTIEYLNLKNGNNQILEVVNVEVSGCVQVDDVAFAEAQANWNVGAGTYSENCSNTLQTYVPDDDFEQALIDLGFDDVLDDYVLTSKMEEIIQLDLTLSNVRDLTGLEGMTNLEWLRLDATANGATPIDDIDVSKNQKLEFLLLPGNAISEIDLSKNLELRGLNLAFNHLEELHLDNLIKLSSLVVNGNRLKRLDLSELSSLEIYILSDNDLNYLNLKNGNNVNFAESVELKGNPDLRCIQVDNAEFSANNPNWRKDNQAFFSINCSVSQFADLAVQNISIGIGSDPCSETPNCYINIDVLQNVEINVSIVKNTTEQIFFGPVSVSKPLFLENLTEGEYRICASSDFIPGFEQCYDVSSSAARNSVNTTITIQNAGQEYTLKAAGSKSYEVVVNNNTYIYDFDSIESQRITFPLEVGINAITVTGNLECSSTEGGVLNTDGISEERLNDSIALFPTITNGTVSIANSKLEAIASVTVSTLNGKRIALVPIHGNPEQIDLDFTGNTNGMYIVKISKMNGESKFIKVILR